MRNILFSCILIVLLVGVVQYSDKEIQYQSTVEISVQKGDTLWTIVSDLNNGSYDNRKIINKIKEMNGLDTAVIKPGQRLIVPII